MKLWRKTVNTTDYTPGMLPATRKAVFFDVLRLQWQRLLLMGLILLLFYTPVLFLTVMKDVYISSLYQALEDASDAQRLSAGQTLAVLDILRSIAAAALSLLFAVGLSGVCRVIRQYAWGENVHLPTDFPKGIRDNYRQTAFLLALCGIISALCLGIYYVSSAYSSVLMATVSLLPVALSVLFVAPILALMLSMIPVYSNTLTVNLKNAFFIFCRHLPKTLLALGCCLLIWLPAMLPDFYCHLFGSIGALLLTPFSLLKWTLYCYELFDIHINARLCPELVGKGTFSSCK